MSTDPEREVTWSRECENCGATWQRVKEHRADGITEHREGYRRLSDWTTECTECANYENQKRPL